MTLEPKKDPGFSFPYEVNAEFDFDENAESERLAKLQNTWLRELLSRFPYSAWFIQGHLGLLRAVKLEPKFRVVSEARYRAYIIIFVSAKYSEAGEVLVIFHFSSVHTFGCIKTVKLCGEIYISLRSRASYSIFDKLSFQTSPNKPIELRP